MKLARIVNIYTRIAYKWSISYFVAEVLLCRPRGCPISEVRPSIYATIDLDGEWTTGTWNCTVKEWKIENDIRNEAVERESLDHYRKGTWPLTSKSSSRGSLCCRFAKNRRSVVTDQDDAVFWGWWRNLHGNRSRRKSANSLNWNAND